MKNGLITRKERQQLKYKKLALLIVACLLIAGGLYAKSQSNYPLHTIDPSMDPMTQEAVKRANVYISVTYHTPDKDKVIATYEGDPILWGQVKERAEIYRLYGDFDTLTYKEIYDKALVKIADEIKEVHYLAALDQSLSDSEVRKAVDQIKSTDASMNPEESPIQIYITYAYLKPNDYWDNIKYEETKRYMTHRRYLTLEEDNEEVVSLEEPQLVIFDDFDKWVDENQKYQEDLSAYQH